MAGRPDLRLAQPSDRAFVMEMARLACTIEERPLPAAEDPEVREILPSPSDGAVVATDDAGRPIGAAWWFMHDPPLRRDVEGRAVPEMAIAVVPSARRRGVGTALIEALAEEAAPRSLSALTLNVHLRNPAARLYTRTGLRVADAGRGTFGVAMFRPLG